MAFPAVPAVLTSVGKGLVAGAAGTLAMDTLWYRRSQSNGGSTGDGAGGGEGFVEWELADAESFDDAGTPAQAGKKLVDSATPFELQDHAAGTTNTVVHWATGMQWGALYGAVTRLLGTAHPVLGVGLGTAAFAAAYTILPALGLYKPITEYDRETLMKDYTAHVVFGVAAAAAFRLLSPRR